MKLEQALKICGNQSSHCLNNMVLALSLLPWLNTREDLERLQAAKVILRNRQKK